MKCLDSMDTAHLLRISPALRHFFGLRHLDCYSLSMGDWRLIRASGIAIVWWWKKDKAPQNRERRGYLCGEQVSQSVHLRIRSERK